MSRATRIAATAWMALLPWASAHATMPAPADAPPPSQLDVRAATLAIDQVRHALPDGWEVDRIRWDSVPQGWQGKAECVLIDVRDVTTAFVNPEGDFRYHPFYKLWLLPPCWEGRMEVATIDPSTPQAFYLGECDDYRVLLRTLGRNTWPEGPEVLGSALGLDTYPLTHQPEHTLDIRAMQRLFQRLHNSAASQVDRWQSQIYGIEERDDLLYLELLTWDQRGASPDPTFLGELAEKETLFLAREALAAFPSKRGLYLRRLTRESFSDVIVVNPAKNGS